MNRKGFTLIELLVVVVIVGILTSFIAVAMNNASNATKDAKRKADIQLLANAVVSYSTENYSSKPISSGCTIGGNCPSTINDSLEPFLATLPNDPNSGTYYTYQSDGNDCTISASLSNGTTYQYSCSTKLATTGTPTSGVCGSTNNSNSYTQPTSNFCSDGTIPTVSISSTGWTWSCPGAYLGTPASCFANKSIDGVCGTAIRTPATAYADSDSSFDSDTICNTGTASKSVSFPGKGSSDNWTCLGLYDGATSANCNTYHGANGVCGSSSIAPNNNFAATVDIASPCSTAGSPTITGSGSSPYTGYWKWTCPGIYSGTNASCVANLKVNGACGGASGSYYESAPTSGLCNSGIPSTSGSWSWTCTGLNGGTTSGTCTANQRQSCAASGGVMTTCGSTPCCKIAINDPSCTIGSCFTTCPSGWTKNGYTETVNVDLFFGSNGGYAGTPCGGLPASCVGCYGYPHSGVCCSTGSHSFSGSWGNECIYTWEGEDMRMRLWYSKLTAIGCQ